MRFGGGRLARRRQGLVAGAALAGLVAVGLTLAVPLLRDRSQHRLERRADREVAATAQRARAVLLAEPSAREADLRLAADTVDGVEVLTAAAGAAEVRLVFRVRVAKTAASVFGWQRADATACFAQVVRRGATPAPLQRLPCPR
ncbi:hypothetical protein GCE86_17550 [Micromonospora terminaliae]|uniref:Uncharacterized protein n=1 Tax=Micromonospora terminaliae TaxID=1914461 RepID=A0AAJ3DK62_9ACTN|nr:hypothetical protein [Micromonospora terminaliae]NES29356.1 hypothetical protein [Micromonospora terminaliae]QGL48670.1 hypothetical protein GCE86_17550 [Micromonospora terminaliae]